MDWLVRFPFVRALQAVMVIAIGLSFAQVVWHASGRVALPNAPLAPSTPIDLAQGTPADVSSFLELAPFGASVATAASGAATDASLDLILVAVRVAEPASFSTATISVASAPASIFRPGDIIGGVARLDRVEPRGVVLDIGGRSQFLQFPELSAAPALQGIYAEKAIEFGAQPIGAAPVPAADTLVEEIRSEIAANPKRLLYRYNIGVADNGYEIGSTPPSELLRAGVKPGDRVLSVNGQPVGVIEQDRQLFETVVASGRARVEILRDGRRLTLTFPLK